GLISLAEPIQCFINPNENFLVWHFHLPIRNKEVQIFEANTFDTYAELTTNKGEKRTCKLIYKGPTHAIMNKDCCYPLYSRTNYRNMAWLFNPVHGCRNVSESEQKRYWQLESCNDEFSIPAQITFTTHGNYIYCQTMNIT